MATLGKLKADNPFDTVNGYVSISHGALEHVYTVIFYDSDELPNSEHSTTLKKPLVMPSKADVEGLL